MRALRLAPAWRLKFPLPLYLPQRGAAFCVKWQAPDRRSAALTAGACSKVVVTAPTANRRVVSMATGAHLTPSSSHSSSELIVVYVTVPSMSVGEAIANTLVQDQLAACVNIVPGVTSIYLWDGKVNKDNELLLIIKTRSALLPDLTAAIKAQHPYQECEVLGLPVMGGSTSYMKWILESTRSQ